MSDNGIHFEKPKTMVARPNTTTAPNIFGPTPVFNGRNEKKSAVSAAPAAGAAAS